MAKVIRSVAEAIGIIEKEVMRMSEANLEKMGSEQTEKEPKHPKVELTGYCVECNAEVSSPRAYFCRICSESFYNGETSDSDAK